MPLAPPADIACELIHRIETTTLDQALGEAERHRRVIGPLAGLKAERPTSNDVGNRLERSRRAKLQSCAERVASGQSQQTATVAVNGVHGFTPLVRTLRSISVTTRSSSSTSSLEPAARKAVTKAR